MLIMHHLPGVRENRQDHLEVYVVQECKKAVSLKAEQHGLKRVQVGFSTRRAQDQQLIWSLGAS